MEEESGSSGVEGQDDVEIASVRLAETEVTSAEVPALAMDTKHRELLERLGLSEYYPEKITLKEVMEKSSNKLETLHDVPWYILNKLIMIDYRGRDEIMPHSLKTDYKEVLHTQEFQEEIEMDPLDELLADSTRESCSSVLHPLDLIVLLFQCSSNLLRQSLCEKMFMCKLAIPLVLPPFLDLEPLFLMWPLRGIYIECRNSEYPVINSPPSIVSCIRLGKLSRSKSKFLNAIINGQKHDTFFRRDCENGMADQVISVGLSEIAWYIPSLKSDSSDQFNKITAFVNYRGDGLLHDVNIKFLQEISNAVLVMVDVAELCKPSVMNTLRGMTSYGTELVLMVSKSSAMEVGSSLSEELKRSIDELKCDNFSFFLDFSPKGDRNLQDLKNDAVSKLNKTMNRRKKMITWNICKEKAESERFRVDENLPECKRSKERAFDLVQTLETGNTVIKKSKKLPLQSAPWIQWAKINKEEQRLEHKPESCVEVYISDLHCQKKKEREKQIVILENPHELLNKFSSDLLYMHTGDRLIYMKWLKIFLDDLSRKTIPDLKRERSTRWQELRQSEDTDVKFVDIRKKQLELEALELQITEASLGPEHLLREICQAYEAISDLNVPDLSNRMFKFPNVMAELLLHGYPIELMDGDASHVPLLWVKAVLKELENRIGDKKIFVLSVLGIQSSGKSTLLNAMFGLQFPVAAGRCSRGVYAQLVPVCKEYTNIKYDYILVVDTEGLRAPEQANAKVRNDNEIATFVIGLGDVTLINIREENVSDIEEVLQIVVHALLKIKLTEKSFALQPCCIFIYQNVGAQNSEEKMTTGWQNFMETLDRATEKAGEEGDAPQFKKFKQVINFDVNKNVYYLSDLWKGDLPMVPANPEYSDKVHEIKQRLFMDMSQSHFQFSVSELYQRIHDLWKGILGQNFVFSFKNGHEMKVYNALEATLADLSLSIKKHSLDWVNEKKNVIMNCEDNIHTLGYILKGECEETLHQNFIREKEKLEDYFAKSDDKEIILQWRDYADLKLEESFKSTLMTTKTSLENEVKVLCDHHRGGHTDMKSLQKLKFRASERMEEESGSSGVEGRDDVEIASVRLAETEVTSAEVPTLAKDAKDREVLEKLGLSEYYPGKITLQEVMEKSTNKLDTLHDVPWYILNKLIMIDYRGRDEIMPPSLKTENYDVLHMQELQEEIEMDPLDELFSDSTRESCSIALHPLDILVVLFQCSSNLLRQSLCEKMFMCKLAIPLVLPPFLDLEPLFLMWSLRNISIECRNSESPVINSPPSIVSCIRLGQLSRSKSKFLNAIINGQKHDTFFNRDCENGMSEQVISKGLTEIAWYIPSLKSDSSDQFNKITAFVNYRGDGLLHDVNIKFLQEISNAVLVMVDVAELCKSSVMESLKGMTSAGTELVLMVSKSSALEVGRSLSEELKRCIEKLKCDNLSVFLDFSQKGERNLQDLKKDAVSKLNKTLNKSKNRITWNICKEKAESKRFRVDENFPECKRSKERALELVQTLETGNTTMEKSKILPLQSAPWVEWAKLNKEEQRLEYKRESGIDEYVSDLHCKKKEERRKQKVILENPHELLNKFSSDLLDMHTGDRLIYMKWLKIFLDDLSRKTIPDLQRKRATKWEEHCQSEDSNVKFVDIREKQKELEALELQIAEASVGPEHLLREICQAYEAISDLNIQDLSKRFSEFPSIMAELLLHGYPLELMDGDASHVPLLWVKAVLKELENRIGDKKIFVLSVLGIQSSGKSTLLNAMFGLQFAVAAGRCTRGVYAQLVPVCKENTDIKYDYILVVDTEGLRAPELYKAKIKHDNEIATFVIGLGDVTLINIKGENVSDIEDVLQIVVHAMLKIKLVQKSFALQPSCIFIHQNVGAQNAEEKMTTGRQKFMETLDIATEKAGEEEDAPQYKKFKQVIHFDVNKNVYYFSDLWKGDLPMAPTNPGYSDKVNEIKQRLLMDIMSQSHFQFSASKLSQRIHDLWKGILGQNFVFSFKNGLEMKVYNSLEATLANLSWSIKKHGMDWLNEKINVIMSCEDNIHTLGDKLAGECTEALSQVFNREKEKLEDYFAKSDDKEIIVQWRDNASLKLRETLISTLRTTKTSLANEVKVRAILIEQKSKTDTYKKEIQQKARKLAEDLRKKGEQSDKKLISEYDDMWNNWIEHLGVSGKDHVDVSDSVMNVLLNVFNLDMSLLKKSLEVDQSRRIKRNFVNTLEKYITRKAERQLKETPLNAHTYVQELFEEIASNIQKKGLQAFIDHGAEPLLKWVCDKIDQMKSKGTNFSSDDHVKFAMSVAASKLATYEIYREQNKDTQWLLDATDSKCQINKLGIRDPLLKALQKKYPHNMVEEEIRTNCLHLQRLLRHFEFDVRKHTEIQKNYCFSNLLKDDDCRGLANKQIEKLYEKTRAYLEKTEFHSFNGEYVVTLIKYIEDMISETEKADMKFKFTKTFKIEMAVHLCQFAIPRFEEKHKMFMDNTDPRNVFSRDFKDIYYKMFRNLYYQNMNEIGFADILCEQLMNALERTVFSKMSAALVDDVRNNVNEVRLKPAFLQAVLEQLLEEESFDNFYEYLTDLHTCFEKWVSYFVNKYLFSDNRSKGTHNTPFMRIASKVINALIADVCNKIKLVTPETEVVDQRSQMVLPTWIEDLHKELMGVIPLQKESLKSLANEYDVVDFTSFEELLERNLKTSGEMFVEKVSKYNHVELASSKEILVYSTILEEVTGCRERCPFCSAPCSRSISNHEGIDHMAFEHYPGGCGSYRWEDTKKLTTENCVVLVAGNVKFMNAKTKMEWHPYKQYKDLYPDWEIHGDPSVDASPYWKWFLVKYASELAEKTNAEMPDIPAGWADITKEQAKQSLPK